MPPRAISTRFLSLLALGLLWVTFVTCRWQPIYWEDVWWHLGVGEYIASHFYIPVVDIFSWTVRGAHWMNTEWVYELVLVACVRLMGITGVIVLKMALMLIAMAFVDARWCRWNATVLERLALSFWVYFVAWPYWVERADLASLALLSFLLYRLDHLNPRDGFGRNDKILWIFIFLLWPNLHGAFLIGLFAIGLRALLLFPSDKKKARELSLWAILCTIASFANPYGAWLMPEILLTFKRDINQVADNIPAYGTSYIFFYLSLTLALGAFALPKKRSWDDLFMGLMVFIFGLYALFHQRFIHFFMVCAFPYAGYEWLKCHLRNGMVKKWTSWNRPLLGVCSLLLFGVAALSVQKVQGGINAEESGYIKGVCDFIESHKIRGPFYNEYKFGSYWIWRFKGDPPVYQDGRHATVEGYDRLCARTLDAQRTPATWAAYADGLRIQAAVVRYPTVKTPLGVSIFDGYFPRSAWGLVYWDDLSLLFVRRNARNAKLLREWEYRTIKPDWSLETYQDQLRHGALDRAALRRELHRTLYFNPTNWRARVNQYWLDQALISRSLLQKG